MPEIIRAESLWKSAADEDNRGRAGKNKSRTAIQERVSMEICMVEYYIRQWIPYAELRQEPMDIM